VQPIIKTEPIIKMEPIVKIEPIITENKKKFQCSYCYKILSSENTLNKHVDKICKIKKQNDEDYLDYCGENYCNDLMRQTQLSSDYNFNESGDVTKFVNKMMGNDKLKENNNNAIVTTNVSTTTNYNISLNPKTDDDYRKVAEFLLDIFEFKGDAVAMVMGWINDNPGLATCNIKQLTN
jgi:hypothetical protein